jgi:hypothetical protein
MFEYDNIPKPSRLRAFLTHDALKAALLIHPLAILFYRKLRWDWGFQKTIDYWKNEL